MQINLKFTQFPINNHILLELLVALSLCLYLYLSLFLSSSYDRRQYICGLDELTKEFQEVLADRKM